MESPVEIRYAGVVIGRAQEVRRADGDSPSFFLVVREPMPVGSVLHLRTGDRETPARVVHMVESSDPAVCGMQVRLIGEAEEVAPEWIPPPAPAAEKARPVADPVKPAMAVIEVDMYGERAAHPSAAETRPQRAPETAKPTTPQTELGLSPAAAPDDTAVSSSEAEPPAAEAAAPSEPVATAQASEPPAAAAPVSETAVPEAVPVAIGSSMTGALKNATEGAPAEKTESAPSSGPAASADAETQSGSAIAAEELPPARPISGPSGRRKTKRRR